MPTGDFYGGTRTGNNLYSDSLVCLEARTGKMVWYYQLVHHDIWDWDIATAPLLIDITVDGKKIKAVAQNTKQSFTYVFDRVTGKPVWPIVEKPVPQSDVPGEKTAATQPFPTKPPAFDRQGSSLDDLIDFTPALKEEAIKIASDYKMGPLFTPPILADAGGKKAIFMLPSHLGGVNWPGGAADRRNRHDVRGFRDRRGFSCALEGRPERVRHGLRRWQRYGTAARTPNCCW